MNLREPSFIPPRKPAPDVLSISMPYLVLIFVLLLSGCGEGGADAATDNLAGEEKADTSVSTPQVPDSPGSPFEMTSDAGGNSTTGGDSEGSDVSYADVIRARGTIRELESAVLSLPDEIDNDRVGLLNEEYVNTLWEASRLARRFWQANPDSEEFDEVRALEKQWVTLLAGQNFEPGIQRLSEIVVESLDDPSVDSDTKYQILVQAVQMAALRERPNGMLAMARKFEEGAGQLLEKFPTRIVSIELLLTPLKVYHSYRQEDEYTRLLEHITALLDRAQEKAGVLEASARTRLEFGAALFELRERDRAVEQVEKVLGLQVGEEIKADARDILSTMEEVLAVEARQDQMIGEPLKMTVRNTASLSSAPARPLSDLPHQALAMFFWKQTDSRTRQFLEDLIAVAEKFNTDAPDRVGIVHVLADDSATAQQQIEALSSTFDEAWYVDASLPANSGEFRKLPLKVFPDIWILDSSRRVHAVRVHNRLGAILFNYFRGVSPPGSATAE